MRHIFVPRVTSLSPLNSADDVYPTRVKARDEVWISVVFDYDIAHAESMAEYYRSIGAVVKLGGPAYGDPGGEFTPGLFTAPGVTITSRGCCWDCDFCYVPKREGRIRHLEVKVGNILQDNNILACNRDHREKVWAMLRGQRAVSLRGGLDARLLRDDDVENIRGLRLFDLWTAYDSSNNRSASIKAITKLRAAGIPQHKIRCYVLIGFDGESMSDAEARLKECYAVGAYPFAQLYDKFKGDAATIQKWKRLARTWSLPAAFKSVMRGADAKVLDGLI